MSKTTGYLSGALIAALSFTACSGDDDPPPPAFDATSHWMVWFEDPGTLQESGPYGSYVMANAAGYLDGVDLTGQVSGNNVSMSVDIGIGVLTFSGTMVTNEVSGTVSIPGVGSANFRMQMFAPTGTFDGAGTVIGEAVATNSTTAFCERYYDDIALTNLTSVNVIDDDGVMRYEIDFQQPGSLAVGQLDASVEPINVVVWTDTTRNEALAIGGTVDITKYDATGFTADYNLDLPGGENVTGSFDVVFDLDAYDG